MYRHGEGDGNHANHVSILFLGEMAWNVKKTLVKVEFLTVTVARLIKRNVGRVLLLISGKKDVGGSLCFFKLGYNLKKVYSCAWKFTQVIWKACPFWNLEIFSQLRKSYSTPQSQCGTISLAGKVETLQPLLNRKLCFSLCLSYCTWIESENMEIISLADKWAVKLVLLNTPMLWSRTFSNSWAHLWLAFTGEAAPQTPVSQLCCQMVRQQEIVRWEWEKLLAWRSDMLWALCWWDEAASFVTIHGFSHLFGDLK